MASVDLTEQQWGQLMNILATTKEHPWTSTNPLLMAIGDQLRTHAQVQQSAQAQRPPGNGGAEEARHE